MSDVASLAEKGLSESDLGIQKEQVKTTYAGRRPPPPAPTIDWGRMVLERARMPTQERLAEIATGWKHAYTEFNNAAYSPNRNGYQEDYWDNKAMEAYSDFRDLIKRKSRLLQKDEDREKAEARRIENYGELQKILANPDFTARRDLVELLQYDIWMNRPHLGSGIDTIDRERREEFEEKKTLARPCLEAALKVAASVHDVPTTNAIFEGYANVAAEDEGRSMLLAKGLSSGERITAAIGFSNAFGFIHTIDTLSRTIATLPDGEERTQLIDVYKHLQGEQVDTIMAELSEVYKAVDFHEYALNSQELTMYEADLIEENAKRISREKRVSAHSLRILDLGAGTGRLTKELIKRGYTNVIAFEYEPHHVEKIRGEVPSATVIQGNWHNLRDTIGRDENIDLIASYGRTLNHNRTACEMVHVFDEMRSSVDPETGGVTIDQPNIDWGEYRNKIHQLNENLRRLGIKEASEDLIFDGPDEAHKFNRRVLRPEQVDALSRLLGFKKGVQIRDKKLKEEAIDNLYYELRVDPDFNPNSISLRDLSRDVRTLGLYAPGTDYNMFVQSWGMTLGQALTYGLGADDIRMRNLQGNPPQVDVTVVGDTLHFSSSLS